MISRKIPDSPPPQQGASNPIIRLTGLCVYLSYTIYFLPESTSLPPPPTQKKEINKNKNNQHATRV